jgi:hypothetical protein
MARRMAAVTAAVLVANCRCSVLSETSHETSLEAVDGALLGIALGRRVHMLPKWAPKEVSAD